MSILAWILVGLVAGFLAKAVMPGTEGEPGGFLGTMILGIVGAIVGGWVWNLALGSPGANGFNIGSIFVAFVGSVIVIGIARMLTRRSTTY
jgi:uncharacterized membrane protein YeaQ/YmgE (transglycosylase-associated protein family)